MKYLDVEGTKLLISLIKNYPLEATIIDDVDYFIGIKEGELVRILNTKNYNYDLKDGSSVDTIDFNATSDLPMELNQYARAVLYSIYNEYVDDIIITLTSNYNINFLLEENHHSQEYYIIILPNSFTVNGVNNTLDVINITWK